MENPDMTSEAKALDSLDEIGRERKKEIYQRVENQKILLTGMPDRARHYMEMNTAQAPQGPMLREDLRFIPLWIRQRINDRLKLVCNPNREDSYTGLHLIKQNLERDLPEADFTLIDHPTRKEILELIDKEYFPIIGLSMGCENQIPDAEKLVQEIEQHYQKWADMMKFLISSNGLPSTGLANAALSGLKTFLKKIPGGDVIGKPAKEWAIRQLEKRFGNELAEEICKNPDLLDDLKPTIAVGNYGATAAKKLFGDDTPLNTEDATKILWDDKNERKEKEERGEEPFGGEGVHDMRVFLKALGFPIQAEPNDPIVSYPVNEPILRPKNRFKRYLYEKIGSLTMVAPSASIATAIGCTNKCSFCNTSKQFDGRKTELFKNTDAMFESMMTKVEQEKNNGVYAPEFVFWFLDENFAKTPNAIERMCELVEKSGENIRWATSMDIDGLLTYKEKHGDFKGLVRGGLNGIWLGIESKADFFDKRGGASEKEVEKLIREIQSSGICVIGSFIVGLPIHTEGETVKYSDISTEGWMTNDDLANKLGVSPGKIKQIAEKYREDNLERFEVLEWFEVFEDADNKEREHYAPELIKRIKEQLGFKKLNIKEDIRWAIGLNTAANQVMMHSDTNLAKNKKASEIERSAGRKSSLDLLGRPDDQYGHICFDNQTDIPDERLEEIDREARRMFFQENGPVALRALMTWWNGFMKFKDSKDPAEIRSATYYYWMAKRNLHLISMATTLFSEAVFEKCSDSFLQRYAKLLNEINQYSPPDSPLNDRYKKVFENHDKEVSPVAKIIVEEIRNRFIAKNLSHSEPARNVEVAEESVYVRDEKVQLDVDSMEPETNRKINRAQPSTA